VLALVANGRLLSDLAAGGLERPLEIPGPGTESDRVTHKKRGRKGSLGGGLFSFSSKPS
jgi:hypothetical protein